MREWRELPSVDRPADDAPREVWCVQGGVPVFRFPVVPPGGDEDWRLGDMEYVMFGGRSCETAYFLWALATLNPEIVTLPAVKKQVVAQVERIAASLEEAARRLREALQASEKAQAS